MGNFIVSLTKHTECGTVEIRGSVCKSRQTKNHFPRLRKRQAGTRRASGCSPCPTRSAGWRKERSRRPTIPGGKLRKFPGRIHEDKKSVSKFIPLTIPELLGISSRPCPTPPPPGGMTPPG